MAISFKSLAGSAKWQKTNIFTSTSSWTCPADVTTVDVMAVSGGGGGGGWYSGTDGVAGGGGGGGGLVTRTLTVVPGTSYTITIGAGGSGGSSDTNSSKGSSSSFGSLLVVEGGGGGGRSGDSSIARTIMDGACSGGPGNTNGLGTGGGGMGSGTGTGTSFAPQGPTPSTNRALSTIGFSAGTDVTSIGGIGINAFCGGGGGALGYSSATSGGVYVPVIRHGAGYGARVSNAGAPADGPAASGVANAGGGGGGGAYNNLSSYAAGNGGSGYMTLKYWSAL